MTTLIDIYEAAGAEINESRTAATISNGLTGGLKPFNILLTVVPIEVETTYEGPERVRFRVLLDPEMVFDGLRVQYMDHDEEIVLYPSQVKIVEK